MPDELYNYGLGGAVAFLLIKELFLYIKGDKNKLITVIQNNTMVMTLIQERMRTHEDSAKDRHIENICKSKELMKKLEDHDEKCEKRNDKLCDKVK